MADTVRNRTNGVPAEAIAYLTALRVYRHGLPIPEGAARCPRCGAVDPSSYQRPPGNVDIAACHRPVIQSRTWDSRKQKLRSGKLGGRDWIEVWPPPPDWHPSWEDLLPLQPRLPEDDDEGLARMVVEEIYDKKTGKLVERRVIRGLDGLALIAASFLAVDLSDGRIDFAIHLCKLAVHAANRLA